MKRDCPLAEHATATELIEALLSGANANELEQQYRSAVPVGTVLRSATGSWDCRDSSCPSFSPSAWYRLRNVSSRSVRTALR